MTPENQQPDYTQTRNPEATSEPNESKPSRLAHIKRLILNPYLIGVLVLILIGGGVTYYAWNANRSSIQIDGNDIEASTLSEEDFSRLAAEQAEIDSTNKTLNVAANSIFNGTMLVRSSLDVQGQLRVGQELTLSDVSIAGQATINNLDLAGDLNVQGDTSLGGAVTTQNNLSVNGSFTVAGSGTFAGNLSANSIEAGSLSFSGDLRISGHIITGGPQTSASRGGAVGGGGTVSVNGNDTAGTVNINTGGGTSSGVMVSVQFGRSYSTTPKVNITPVGAASGGLNWYVTRTTNGFSIGTSSTPPSGSNFAFDYFIVE